MTRPTSTKLSKDQSAEQAQGRSQERARQPTPSGLQADILALQRASGNQAVSQLLRSGRGQPLDASTRDFMESRFNHDFSRVRIHTDGQAAESARAANAAAYTVGNQVIFGLGQYAPGTMAGMRLLAHELTHVVQQQNASSNLQTLSIDDSPTSLFEREAETAGATAIKGQHATVSLRTSAPNIQRTPWGSCPPGRRLPASNPFRYQAAELALVLIHYKQVRGGNVVASNVDLLEELPTRGREGPMVEAMQNHFRSGRGPSPIRRRQRTGTPEAHPAPTEGAETLSEQITEAAREAVGFALVRPDIIDVTEREVYDITTERLAGAKVNKVRGYVQLLEGIRVIEGIGGRRWRAGRTLPAPPPHILNYWINNQEVVYFGPTDFQVRPGVIAYIVIESSRRRRRRRQPQEEPVPIHVPVDILAMTTGINYYILRRAMARRAGARVGTQAVARLGVRAVVGATVGLVILASDVAQAAYKLSRGAHFGGEGVEELPEGVEAVKGEWITPELTEEELEEFAGRDIPQELIDALEGDLVLQQFFWDVARLRIKKQGNRPSAEELEQLSSVLQDADPEALQRILPYLRMSDDRSMQDLAEAMHKALAIPESELPPPPTQEERQQPPPPTTTEEPGISGTTRTGTQLSREQLSRLDQFPNLKDFFDNFLAPATQQSGTPITPEFLEFLLENAATLNKPEVLARIRRTSREGLQDLESLQKAIAAHIRREAEESRRTRPRKRATTTGKAPPLRQGQVTRCNVVPLTQLPPDGITIQSFELVRGLVRNRRYRRGQVVRITIRVARADNRYEITIPVIIDRRRREGREVTVEAHVKGSWQVSGTDLVLPADAPVTYTWRR